MVRTVYALKDGVTAAADGDECIFIPPNDTRLVPLRGSYNAIAIGGAVKLNLMTGLIGSAP